MAVNSKQPQAGRLLSPEFDTPALLALPGQGRPVITSSQAMTYPVDVTAPLFTLGSTTVGYSRSGAGVITGTAGFSFTRVGGGNEAFVETPAGSDFTWIFQTDNIGYTAGNPGYFRSNSGQSGTTFALLPTSGLWVRLNGSDFTSSIASPTTGSTATVVISVRSGLSVRAWINGIQVLNGSTATTSADCTGINGVNRFAYHSGTEYLTGNHTLVGHWHRAFPDARNLSLSLNPWQVFAPTVRRKIFVKGAAGATSHAATGSPAASAATVAGTATHLLLHPSTGAAVAGSATVAGTATHLTLHASTGALAAQAATVSGTALHPHTSTGALTAQAATVAGTALHPHASTGALSAGSATVSGTALHPHTSTGALTAQVATIAGTVLHPHTSTGSLVAGSAIVAGSADHSVIGGAHPATGTPTASPALVAGTAAHLTLHTSTGSPTADAATVSGTAAHLIAHAATGSLVADAASVSGLATGPNVEAPPPPTTYPGKTRRRVVHQKKKVELEEAREEVAEARQELVQAEKKAEQAQAIVATVLAESASERAQANAIQAAREAEQRAEQAAIALAEAEEEEELIELLLMA